MFLKSDRKPSDGNFYKKNEYTIDFGYQSLKKFIFQEHDFSNIKNLYIHNNNLKELPDPKYFPNIQYLDCSNNRLTNIPFYKNLKYLIIKNNNVYDLINYNNSGLKYLDVSDNIGIDINIILNECKEIYCSHCNLSAFKINKYNKIKILDISNNRLSNIDTSESLVELNIENNKISDLCLFPNLTALIIKNNRLEKINKYPNLLVLNASNNFIKHMDSMDYLKELIISNNRLDCIPYMKGLRYIDLSNNLIKQITIPNNCEYIDLSNNLIKQIIIPNNCKHLYLTGNKIEVFSTPGKISSNIEMGYYSYSSFMKYCDNQDYKTDISINSNELKELIKKLEKLIPHNKLEILYDEIIKIDFNNCIKKLKKITKIIYEINETDNRFHYCYETICSIYKKSIIVKIYCC